MADPHELAAHIPTGQALHTENHDHDGTPTQKLAAANTHETPSADTHHAKNHTMAEHEAMGRMVLVRKTADESVSLTTTSQNDDELFFAIGANEVWLFSIGIIYNSGSVGDFKYQVAAPSGATGYVTRAAGGFAPIPLGTDSVSIAGTASDVFLGSVWGVVVNSSTAGNVQLLWGPFATDAVNTTVKANSFLMAHRVV